ncbi:MAG: ATP-binding protein [Micropepsaceae bacterium]
MKALHLPLWLELTATVLAALLLSNAVTFAVAEHRRADSIRIERLGVMEGRLSALHSLLKRLPEDNWQRLLALASVRQERVSLGDRPRVALDADRDEKAEDRLKGALGMVPQSDVRVAKRGSPQLNLLGERKKGGYERFSVAIAIGPQKWINAEFRWPDDDTLLPGLLFSAVISGAILTVLSAWIAFRLSVPLRQLAAASQRMKIGKPVQPLVASGPSVLRGAVKSFNEMAQRIIPIVDNQRVVLASVGHDLRTPITSLRLKSEFIVDESLRNQFVGSIDELQTLTEAALAASRNGLSGEATREIDVGSLVESICADLSDMGSCIQFRAQSRVIANCRPNEIKRAVRNLVENAIKYGGSADVLVCSVDSKVIVAVEDEGPGIAVPDLGRAFEPFVRLHDPNCSQKTGHGLGLSIARSIARAHGGDVRLRRRRPRGLHAEMTINVA